MRQRRSLGLSVVIVMILLAGIALWRSSPQAMSSGGIISGKEGCLHCHSGIEDINPKMTQHFYSVLNKKPGFECSVCHMGNPMAMDKDSSHRGMIVNPSDLSVAEKICGSCHKDHVDRVEKSLMANVQGEIAGTLYARGYTKDKNLAFAMSTHAIVDKDGIVPKDKGAVERLEPIPDSKEHISIEMLRKFCIKCHLRGDGVRTAKAYRSSGCAACHMQTVADGRYAGSDPTLKGAQWRPAVHRITTKVSSEQCARCHKGGNRIGVSYISELPGHESDIHYQRGMHCIDCHSSKELHGDGNIYMRKWQAVKVRCSSCHGDHQTKPTFKDAEGERLKNIREDAGRYILTSKVTGKEHTIPTIDALKAKDKLSSSMLIPQHLNKMECASCHSTKNVNCYACHFSVDRTKMGKDIITGAESPGLWSIVGGDFSVKWKAPPLSMHQSAKVAPNQLGCAVHITEIDKEGKKVRDYSVNQETAGKTKDGFTAFARVSVGNAHTIQRSGIRSCNECHNNPSALGMGGKGQETFKTGKMLMADPDRFVDEEGNQLLAFSQPGQRPLNKAEIIRIQKVGECTLCHSGDGAGFWSNYDKHRQWFELNTALHRQKVESRLRQ